MPAKKSLDTSLFRPREEVDQEQEKTSDSRDMSPTRERREKRASFDLYADQISRLGQLKYKLAEQGEKRRISDMVKDAVEAYLREHNA